MGSRIVMNPDFREAAADVLRLLEDRERLKAKGVVKSNMVRSVYRVEAGGFPIFLKTYHAAGLFNMLKSLVVPSRALAEWTAMMRLTDLHIPTALPIAYGETRRCGFLIDSFFAALAVGRTGDSDGLESADALQFNSVVAKMKRLGTWSPEKRDSLYSNLAKLVSSLHRHAVKHGDFHVGNVVAPFRENESPELHIIDLHAVSFPSALPKRTKLLNLAKVAEGIRYNERDDVRFFLEKYLALNPGFAGDLDTLDEEISRMIRQLDRRRIRSRTRRCLARSTEFLPAQKAGCRMNLRRPFTPDEVLDAIGIHDSVPRQGDERLIFPSNKNKVTVVETETSAGPTKLCVKEYRKQGLLRRLCPVPSEAKRSWIAGRGLEVRLVGTPETVAWARKEGRHYLITRFVDKAEKLFTHASRCMESMGGAARAGFLRGLAEETARFMRQVHESGVRHRDMSEQNLLVEGEEGKRAFFLTDLDTVRFVDSVGERRIVKNLVQLGHLPPEIDVIPKARFLKAYLGKAGKGEFRRLLGQINSAIVLRMASKRMRYARRGDYDPHPFPSKLKREW